MSSVLAPAMAAALLLALAGAQKVLDPTQTMGALAAQRLPAGAGLVRIGALVELLTGILAIAFGGALWWLVAVSYVAFTVFVALAIRRRVPIGTCGCFGRAETHPTWGHVRLNLVFLAAAAAAATLVDASPTDELALHPAGGAFVYLVSAGMAAVAYLIYAGESTRATPSESTD